MALALPPFGGTLMKLPWSRQWCGPLVLQQIEANSSVLPEGADGGAGGTSFKI